MSSGQRPRTPEYFPRMKYRAAKRYAGTYEGYVRQGGYIPSPKELIWSGLLMVGDLIAERRFRADWDELAKQCGIEDANLTLTLDRRTPWDEEAA